MLLLHKPVKPHLSTIRSILLSSIEKTTKRINRFMNVSQLTGGGEGIN